MTNEELNTALYAPLFLPGKRRSSCCLLAVGTEKENCTENGSRSSAPAVWDTHFDGSILPVFRIQIQHFQCDVQPVSLHNVYVVFCCGSLCM